MQPRQILILVLLPLIAFAFCAKKSGSRPPWNVPPEAAARANPIASDAASIERGRKLYFQNCDSCHGAKAKGYGSYRATLNPKPANLIESVTHHPAGNIAYKIEKGRMPMPAWENKLTSAQIWDIINYLISLRGPLPGGEPQPGHEHNHKEEHGHHD